MWVIKVKGKEKFTCRKPYKLTDINNCDIYKTDRAARIAITASKSPFPKDNLNAWGIADFDQLEVKEVLVTLK